MPGLGLGRRDVGGGWERDGAAVGGAGGRGGKRRVQVLGDGEPDAGQGVVVDVVAREQLREQGDGSLADLRDNAHLLDRLATPIPNKLTLPSHPPTPAALPALPSPAPFSPPFSPPPLPSFFLAPVSAPAASPTSPHSPPLLPSSSFPLLLPSPPLSSPSLPSFLPLSLLFSPFFPPPPTLFSPLSAFSSPSSLSVSARRFLLACLSSLFSPLPPSLLFGCHAVYLRVGQGDLATTPATTDADLALDPSRLGGVPLLDESLAASGFVPKIGGGGPIIGTWVAEQEVAGARVLVDLDLLVPEAASGPGTRAARLGAQGDRLARKAPGLELAPVSYTHLTLPTTYPV